MKRGNGTKDLRFRTEAAWVVEKENLGGRIAFAVHNSICFGFGIESKSERESQKIWFFWFALARDRDKEG